MQLNKKSLKDLLYSEFDGNFNKMARELGINVAQLYRVLEKDSNAGAKFFCRLMLWCNQHGHDFNDYIFLSESLTGVNKKEVV
jgi:hypothetical protein